MSREQLHKLAVESAFEIESTRRTIARWLAIGAGVVVTLGKAEEGKDRQMRNKGFSALFRFFQYLLLIKLRIFS